MKKKLSLAVAIVLSMPAAVMAVEGYMGASLGVASYDADGRIEGREADVGGKVYGGVQFNRYFGAEVGYTHLGDHEAWDIDVRLRPQSVYLAATGTVPLSNVFALHGKAGVTRNKTRLEVNGFSDDYTKTQALLGIGGSWSFSRNLALAFDYEYYGKLVDDKTNDIEFKGDLLSVGLRYKF